MKRITFLMLLFFSFGALVCREDARVCKHGFPLISGGLTESGNMLFSIAQDMVGINLNLFSFDTFKIFTIVFPFVVAGRMADGCLQSWFYDRKHHKNIRQLDDAFRQFSEHSIVFPVFLAGALSVAAHDEDLKATSRMFFKGLPFVLLISDAIKQWDDFFVGEGCLRPWNEHFGRIKRSPGGFPSGHLASCTYAATLFGHRFGAKWAVPLGVLTAVVAISFLNCNRHYLSQIFAGAGVGAIFGIAASRQVDFRLSKQRKARVCVGADFDSQGSPAMKVGISF